MHLPVTLPHPARQLPRPRLLPESQLQPVSSLGHTFFWHFSACVVQKSPMRPLMPARAAVSFGQLVGVCRPGVDVGWPLCDLRHLREAMSSALTTILNLHWSDGVGSLLETPYHPTHKLLMASLFLGSQLHPVHSLGCKFEGKQQPQQSHSPLMVNVTWKRLSMVGRQPCPELQSFLNRSQGSVGPRWAAAGPAAI